jgi:branched-chain amino acid transport system permease protein
VGGIASLWGAVLGALLVSALDSFLIDAENGQISGFDLPGGTRLVVVGAFMAGVLIFLPQGLTGGREFRLPRLPRGGRPRATPPATSEAR